MDAADLLIVFLPGLRGVSDLVEGSYLADRANELGQVWRERQLCESVYIRRR